MSYYEKIKPLSKALVMWFIKKVPPTIFKNTEVFNPTTKAQMLKSIKEGEHQDLLKQIDTTKDWKKLRSKLIPGRNPIYYQYIVAASLLILLALAILLKKETQQAPVPVIINNQIEVGTDKAILTLETGEEVILNKGTTYQSSQVASNGETIIYHPANDQSESTDKDPMVYNTLTVPRGGQFYIKLSDGTQVWLNSDTRLRYPKTFKKGSIREVELVYGEAYFEVSPSTLHKGSGFKVNHSSQEVEALGTQFNIKAYRDESQIYTTLVEGKVAVKSSGNKQLLAPNEQSILTTAEAGAIKTITVDVYNEVSWKEGVFSFEDKPLKDIIQVLSRWYNMDVIIEDTSQKEALFIGTFNKSSSIEDILLAIQSTNIITSYEIRESTIKIK